MPVDLEKHLERVNLELVSWKGVSFRFYVVFFLPPAIDLSLNLDKQPLFQTPFTARSPLGHRRGLRRRRLAPQDGLH